MEFTNTSKPFRGGRGAAVPFGWDGREVDGPAAEGFDGLFAWPLTELLKEARRDSSLCDKRAAISGRSWRKSGARRPRLDLRGFSFGCEYVLSLDFLIYTWRRQRCKSIGRVTYCRRRAGTAV